MRKEVTTRAHFRSRAKERLGLVLSDQAAKDISRMCLNTNSKVLHLASQTCARKLKAVVYQGSIIPLVFNKAIQCVTTVLTYEMLSLEQQRYLDDFVTSFGDVTLNKCLEDLKTTHA